MSNVLFALWMSLSVGLVLLFFYAAYLNWRNHRTNNVDLGEILPSFLPVDVEALAALIGPAEEELLRQEHSREEFVQIQRQRARLTIDALRRMTRNAALLQKLGYSELHSPNDLICSLAQEMIEAGVYVRLYSFVGLVKIHLRGWLTFGRPLFEPPDILSSSLIPAYEQLKDKAGNLTCLKFSSLHEALIQSL